MLLLILNMQEERLLLPWILFMHSRDKEDDEEEEEESDEVEKEKEKTVNKFESENNKLK